jgi:hypothetical protein
VPRPRAGGEGRVKQLPALAAARSDPDEEGEEDNASNNLSRRRID